MTRVEFTKKVINLLARMFLENEEVFIDYCKRSDDEQMHLFLKGSSKCNGVKSISPHQIGRAIDLYFLDGNGRAFDNEGDCIPPKKGFEYWHQVWKEIGGNPMITWDKGHFEV